METTLINTKKRVPDKGCTHDMMWCSNSKWFSIICLILTFCLGCNISFAQLVEPSIDGHDSDWTVLNINSFSAHAYVQDRSGSGVVDDGFDGGSKDILNNGWVDGQTKTKNDISNAAALLTNNRLYFAGDRDGTNGDSMIACWFFLNGTKPDPSGEFLPLHAIGDILVVANFTNGGTTPDVEVYKWVGSGGDIGSNGALQTLSLSAGLASLNTGPIDRPTGWKGSGQYDVNQFFEGYINLANLNIPSLCFSSFLLETRSSQSVTAQLDDFAAGNFTAVPLITGTPHNLTCFGGSNGSIDISVTGGTPPYKFDWDDLPGSDNGEDRTGLAAGIYKVIVSDNNGCHSEQVTFTLTQPDALGLILTPTNATCNGTANGSISAAVTGTPLSDLQIKLDAGAWTAVAASPVVFNNLSAVSHTVALRRISDNNCMVSDSKTVSQPDALGLVLTPSNATCNGGNMHISAAVTGTPLNDIQIQLDGGAWAAVAASPVVFNNLTAASHTVALRRISDNDCMVSDSKTVSQPDALGLVLTPFNATCNGGNMHISAAVTGTPLSDLQIQLDGGAWAAVAASPVVFNNLTAASHTVTLRRISDNNCMVSDSKTVSQPDALGLVLTPTGATCNGTANGSISTAITGTPLNDLQIQLDGGAWAAVAASPVVFNNLTAASHTVTLRRISDNNCMVSDSKTVSQPGGVQLTVTPHNPDCYLENGSIDFSAIGGTGTITYTVDSVSATSPFTATTSKVYTIVATDANNCSDTKTATITILGGANIDVTCPANSGYTVDCTKILSANQTALNLAYQTWSNGFSFTGGFNPPILGKDPVVTKNFFDLVDDGQGGFNKVPSTDTPPSIITGGIKLVEYSVADDCSNDKCESRFTVLNPCDLSCNATVTNYVCFGEIGKLSAVGSGGVAPYTLHVYQIVNNVPNELAGSPYTFNADFTKDLDLLKGDYRVTVNDALFNPVTNPNRICIKNVSITGPASALVLQPLDQTSVTCAGANTGTITATFAGGTSPYMIQLDSQTAISVPQGTLSQQFDNVSAGQHTVTVFEAGYSSPDHVTGCSDSKNVTVGTTPCNKPICTYTQGAYGNAGGKNCDGLGHNLATFNLINQAINNAGGSITVGILGQRSVTMTSSPADINCVISKLPGGGAASALPSGFNGGICSGNISLNKQGRIVNVLLSQTITLALNMNIKGPNEIASFVLQAGTLATAALDGGCGSTIPKQRVCAHCENGLCVGTVNEYNYITFSPALISVLGNNATIGGLLDLANRALAGQSVGISLSAISDAVASINEGFDGCRLPIDYNQQKCPSCPDCSQAFARNSATDSTSGTSSANMIIAYPNPFKDHLTFELSADVSANASLQVFNILGQKVSDVFNGYLEAGTRRTIDFNTPYNMNETMLIYVYKLGDHTYTGRLIIRP